MIGPEAKPDLAWMRERRLLVLTGKGGVGKTVLAAGLGAALADSGLRVLLAEVRSPRRIPPLFGVTESGDGPQALADGLEWINFTPGAALEVYGMQLLKLRTVYRAVFEQQAVRRFLRVIPSLAEILMLGHLRDLVERDAADVVVLDAPSTGPGALMLEAPQALIETAPPGPLRDGAVWIRELLADERSCAVNLVVLAEELPVSEAIDLYHRLRDQVSVPLGVTLANRILPDPFAHVPAEVLDEIAGLPQAAHLAAARRSYAKRLGLQAGYLDRLAAGVPLPLLRLPEVTDQPAGAATVQALQRAFAHRLGGDR